MQLALPNFDTFSRKELEDFAAVELSMMRTEAQTASTISQTAFQRAWKVGKACVKLKESVSENDWEKYAAEHVGGGDYYAVYRCMRLARMSPDAPPLQKNGSSQYKQLQIAIGEESAPKATPRKTDVYRFQNLIASIGCIRRWWREGEVMEMLDHDMMQEIVEDLEFIINIHEALEKQISEAAVPAEGG